MKEKEEKVNNNNNMFWAVNLSAANANKVYLAGKYTNTNIERTESYYPGPFGSGYSYYRYYINGIKITNKGVSEEKKQILKYYKTDSEDVGERSEYGLNFVFFQAGSSTPDPVPPPDIPEYVPEEDTPEIVPEDDTPVEFPDISSNMTWYDGAGNKYVRDGQTGTVTVYDIEGNVIGTYQN